MLFLAASPASSDSLRHEQERTSVRDNSGRRIDMHDESGVSRETFVKLLDKHTPEILHISCHGQESGDGKVLLLQDQYKNRDPISPAWLVARLRGNPSIKLVVLSACHSDKHVASIAHALPNLDAIGFRVEIGEDHAKKFSANLYHGLATGGCITDAFAGACAVVPEAVQKEIVHEGPGHYRLRQDRLPQPALLGGLTLAAIAITVIFVNQLNDGSESPASSIEASTGLSTSTTSAPSTGSNSSLPPTTSTSSTDSGSTSTSTGPPTGRTSRPPKPEPFRPSDLQELLDTKCRDRHPDSAAQLVLSWLPDKSGFRVQPYVDQACNLDSLCACIGSAIRTKSWPKPPFTAALLRYNSSALAPRRFKLEEL